MTLRKLIAGLIAVLIAASPVALAEGAALFGMTDGGATAAPRPANTISAAELFGISQTNPYATPTATPEPTPTPTPAPLVTPDPATAASAAPDPFGIEGEDPDGDGEDAIVPGATVYVTAGVLPILETTDDSARVLMNAAIGQQLTVSAAQGDWARIQLDNGAMGYCRVAGLSTQPPKTMSRQMYVQISGVKVYDAPSQDANVIGTFYQGETVTQTAITADGLWSRVTRGEAGGFMLTMSLDEAPYGAGTPVWCAIGSTPVMVNPDHWTQVTRLCFGQQVELAGYVNGTAIAKIRTGGGYVAYCASSALTAANPVSVNRPAYTQAGGAILFEQPWTDAATVEIGKGTAMTLLGVDSTQTWALVERSNQRGYIPYVFLGGGSPGDDNRVVITTRSTAFYTAPDQVGDVLAQGTELYLYGGSGAMAAVTLIGDAGVPQGGGYVAWEDLRAK